MQFYVKSIALAGLLSLGGCAAPDQRIVYKQAKVAVAVGCVSQRPIRQPSLLATYSDEGWAAMPPGAKASALEARAAERMNYTDRLEAATAACPMIEGE